MKQAGIVADNYKLNRFKKELTANGFTDFEIVPFTEHTSVITVDVSDDDVVEVRKICQRVELFFKRGN